MAQRREKNRTKTTRPLNWHSMKSSLASLNNMHSVASFRAGALDVVIFDSGVVSKEEASLGKDGFGGRAPV